MLRIKKGKKGDDGVKVSLEMERIRREGDGAERAFTTWSPGPLLRSRREKRGGGDGAKVSEPLPSGRLDTCLGVERIRGGSNGANVDDPSPPGRLDTCLGIERIRSGG